MILPLHFETNQDVNISLSLGIFIKYISEVRNTINKKYNSLVSSIKQYTIFQKRFLKIQILQFFNRSYYFDGIVHYRIYKGEKLLIFITVVTSIKKFSLKA